MTRLIRRADIMDMAEYAKTRKQHRATIVAAKHRRRVAVGPFATFYFENFDTMWHQVHEMLYIERGGDAQIDDELAAYNPLIPNGRELVATVMFEIEDKARRQQVLATLGGVEETAFIQAGENRIKGVPETDVDRTTAAGKASAVQFLHFPFSPAAIAAFQAGGEVVIGFTHSAYSHMAVLPDAVRAALSEDFASDAPATKSP